MDPLEPGYQRTLRFFRLYGRERFYNDPEFRDDTMQRWSDEERMTGQANVHGYVDAD